MKKFITGVISGALLTSTIAFAVSYVAEPASFKVLVNGNEFNSDPPALVVEGSTYLPLRAMGEALNVPVEWNSELGQAEVGVTTPIVTANISNDTQSNDKWKMTYLNYKTVSEVNDYTKAPDGKEFLIVFFEIENISAETQNFSLFNLDYYIDDFKAPQTMLATQIDNAMQLAASQVEAGKKAKGYLAFEVVPDWKKVDITYNEDLLKQNTENAMSFTLTK